MDKREISTNVGVDTGVIRDTIQFHRRLNDKLWTADGEMWPEVRVRLLRVALSFYSFLELPGLKVADIVVTGSNAAFNYTSGSDVDVHLIVDYERTVCPEIAENLFTTKKNLYNHSHDIAIRGFPVEVYVENKRNPAYSNGVYSLLTGTWVKQASRTAPSVDDAAVVAKTQDLAARIDALVNGAADADQIAALMHKLKTMRKSGLSRGGEFSVENLTFKSLRALGYLDRMRELRRSLEDASMSLGQGE